MEPETSQRLCGNDAMFERKGDIVLPRNKHSFVLQLVLFYTAKESILYNSLIISTYKIEKRKRVTIWLLLKFPELP